MTQAETFLKGEGTAWLRRNAKRLPVKKDIVLAAMDQLVGSPGKDSEILEIGCANGWRLEEIKKRYGCTKLYGLDPSANAVTEAKKRGIKAVQGVADSLPFRRDFDIVIYGFCLYLCDRDRLFTIAAEGDRVLSDGGLMVIYDFNTPIPCKNEYKHKKGIWSYKQNYDQMFLWNPAYSKLLTVHHLDGKTKATILKKHTERGWPECVGPN